MSGAPTVRIPQTTNLSICRSQDAVSFSLKKHGLGSRSNVNTLSQSMKPTFRRKLTVPARVNLNNYWNNLEELVVPPNNQRDSENEINEKLRFEQMTIGEGKTSGGTGFGGRSPLSQHNSQDTCMHNEGSS